MFFRSRNFNRIFYYATKYIEVHSARFCETVKSHGSRCNPEDMEGVTFWESRSLAVGMAVVRGSMVKYAKIEEVWRIDGLELFIFILEICIFTTFFRGGNS